jgi:chemotaxis protein methyltransferase CheR
VSALPRPSSHADEQLSPTNFRRLAAFVHEYSGIKMPPTKKTMLEGRVRRRMRACGFSNVNDYCRRLFDEPSFLTAELVHLMDAVTTNKTEFFREPAHFDYLASDALPALMSGRGRTLKAWSAAASTGAEAYTLAMVLDEACAGRQGWSWSILGTDLSTQVLAQAAAAIYPQAMIEPVPVELRRRHLLQARDPARRQVRIAPHLRARVAFGRLNLMDEQYPVDEDFDLLFCRNILIYFDKPTQSAVLRRLCAHLRPGGYLFLGHSETILGLDLPVVTVANTVFRRL